MEASPILAYFGHHRCGTQWTASIVEDVCSAAGLTAVRHDNSNRFQGDILSYRQKNPFDFWCYINADYRFVRGVDVRGFHVVRDPRDVIVSAYFSHLTSHPVRDRWPQLRHHRNLLQSLSKDEGILQEMEFSASTLYAMLFWDPLTPNVREIRFEDLIQNSEDKFCKIFAELGLVPSRVSETVVREIVGLHAFQCMSGGRQRGEEDTAHHFRKGVPGDWRNHFKPSHIDHLKKLFNPLLIKLGYEANESWTNEVSEAQDCQHSLLPL
jgi:Sulfotransferase domain